jgi:hypothetical protein
MSDEAVGAIEFQVAVHCSSVLYLYYNCKPRKVCVLLPASNAVMPLSIYSCAHHGCPAHWAAFIASTL